MVSKGIILFLGLIASGRAAAASLEFYVRCGLAEPVVKVELSRDPREVVECRRKRLASGGEWAYLYFATPIEMKVGTQTYKLEGEWASAEASCEKTLQTFRGTSSFMRVEEPVTGGAVSVLWRRDEPRNSIAIRLTSSALGNTAIACTGRM